MHRLLNIAITRIPGRQNKIFFLLVLAGSILLLQPLRSQTFTEVDTITYRLYVEKNWDELILAGKSALKEDFDYYYLRMRIGIAFYEKKYYKAAQVHFKKALEFNTSDPVASEYLYYSYLFGRQTQQAALLYREFPASLKEGIPDPGLKIVDRISVEYLYNKTFTDEIIDDTTEFRLAPYGVHIITRDFHNLNISLHHFMHPGTSFTHAYTYLGKSNFYHYDDGIDSFGIDGLKVSQHQYYLSPSFTFQGGLVISPYFHFLYVGYQLPDLTAGGPGPGGGNIVLNDYYMSQMVGGLSLVKYQGSVSIRLGAVYSNLNNVNQFTGSGGLTWFPMGNPDVYLGASLHAHMDDMNTGNANLVQDVLFGYGIASKLWIEISGAYGKMRNYTESNGYIVYNGIDWMRSKTIINFMVPLTEKGSVIYTGVRFAQYQSQGITFDPALADNEFNKLTYNSLSIFGGLSWKF